MASTLTVSQLNRYLASNIKQDRKLNNIAVTGELADLNINLRSGHMYFTIKDSDAKISAVMFSYSVERLRFMPKDGMQILALGSVEYYERDGKMEIKCTDMTPMGEGAQKAALEKVKQKLSQMGVFSDENKKKLPQSPRKIGVITSLDGAAVHDVLSVIKRRFPSAKVVISPTAVQGVYAEQDICNAIKRADNCDCDVLILTRGGGSGEDLKTFNAESVTMAVYNCKTPIISAVGHEVDTTLCDYAADMRAPTPSAAAEIAVPQSKDLSKTLAIYENSINTAMKTVINAYYSRFEIQHGRLLSSSPNVILDKYNSRFEMQRSRMLSLSPFGIIEKYETRLSQLDKHMNIAVTSAAAYRCHTLEREYSRLCALDPLAVLKRGYAHVTDKNGKTITAEKANVGETVNIKTAELEMTAKILTVNKDH